MGSEGSGVMISPRFCSSKARSRVLTLISPPMHLAPCPHFSSMVSMPCFLMIYSATPNLVSSTFIWTKMSPYLSRYPGRAQSAGENRNLHLHLDVPAVLGFCTHSREKGGIRVADNTF